MNCPWRSKNRLLHANHEHRWNCWWRSQTIHCLWHLTTIYPWTAVATPRCMLGARACVMYLSECSTSRIRGYHGTDTLAGIGLDCTGFMADCNVGWSDEAMTACWLCSAIAGLVIQLFASHCAWLSILRSWLQLSVRLSVCLPVCLNVGIAITTI